ncbi:MAG: hypothetical protein EPO08_09290 [Rhodospirillaceae bacterium]|nr:MAG: hypothetical protein EPO08_09290 [Rhodospirillaceae bacterium]
MAQSESQSHRAARVLPAVVVLLLAAAAYGAIATNVFHNGGISFAEGLYMVKSWWYVTGAAAPYTATDATRTTPLYFYLLGWWQSLAGIGVVPARALSCGLGLVNGALLFAICRRLTGNVLAAAAAVMLLLATPTTAFYFAMAVPTATVSALHLAAIWLIVAGLGRPRVGATIVFGLICVALYFTRQNMILAVVMLAPLYVAAIGRGRWLHAALLLATMAIATAALLLVFPDRLAGYAMHLPVITPYLERWGVLPTDLALIDEGTTGPTTMALALDRLHLADFVNGFLLPFSGIVALALLLFFVAGRGLRVLWIAPLYFAALVAGHFVATAGNCTTCLPDYGSTYMAAGALAAALTLAVLASRVRHSKTPPALVIVGGALIATGMNVFAPALATRDEYLFFPAPLLAQSGTGSAPSEIDPFAQWLATSIPMGEPILLIHNLGGLPYAVFRAGHVFPVQNFNPAATHRVLRPRLSSTTREAVQAAVEAESLWTDDTLRRWLERDYDLVLFQDNKAVDQSAIVAVLTQRFDVAGTTTFHGANLILYKRKPAQ